MGTGSRPSADRSEVERLLHLLRSTLARLKAELELADKQPASLQSPAMDTVNEALLLVDQVERAAISRPVTGQRTVLVVDDDIRLATAIARQVLRLGVPAIAQANLDNLGELSPDAVRVLIDLGVLRTSTREVIDALAGYHMTVMTGSADPLARLEARSYGASAVLVKPIDPAQLVDQTR